MAKILNNFTKPRKGGRPCLYPWNEWFDGATRRLTRGEDFHTTLHAMEVLIRRTASKRRVKVSLSMEPKTQSLVLEFISSGKPARKSKKLSQKQDVLQV